MVLVGIEMLHLLRARMRSARHARRMGRKRCLPEDWRARCETARVRHDKYEAHDTGQHPMRLLSCLFCGGFFGQGYGFWPVAFGRAPGSVSGC